MQARIFASELNEKRRECCQGGGHSFAQVRAVIGGYNDVNRRRPIRLNRVLVFFRSGLKISCDCQVLQRFRPFSDQKVLMAWNYAVLNIGLVDYKPVEREEKHVSQFS